MQEASKGITGSVVITDQSLKLFALLPFSSLYIYTHLHVLVYIQFINLHSILMLCVPLVLLFWTWSFTDILVKRHFLQCITTLLTVTSRNEGE